MWPQRVYPAVSGVTSLDWSTKHPTLLAVGYYDGNIAVYDTRRNDTTPVLESSQLASKHTGAVWQVKWVQKGPAAGGASATTDEKDGGEAGGVASASEKTETLVSISIQRSL